MITISHKIVYIMLIAAVFIADWPMLATKKQSAVIIVPVADMVGNPCEQDAITHSSLGAYTTIPLCGGPIPRCYLNCPRIHQGLFNEIVHIVQEQGDQVHIALDTIFYVDSLGMRHNQFWIHKSSIMPLKQLVRHGCPLENIPPTMGTENAASTHKKIITLQDPWYDPDSQLTFSAGTRFVASEQRSADDTIDVMILDPHHYTYRRAQIPKKLCAPSKHKNKQEQIAYFVQLMRHWIDDYEGFIPYVWGGISFTKTSRAPFQEHTVMHNTDKTFFYTIADTNTVKTGMDCSGLIARAAHICQIPYFFKNTATLAKYLTPIKNEALAEGDLIWMQGHVMVVSQLKNNMLIEARAYEHGYGKVQEIALDKVFKGMHTYAHLIEAYKIGKPLIRLDKNGAPCGKPITQWKLLRLASIWD